MGVQTHPQPFDCVRSSVCKNLRPRELPRVTWLGAPTSPNNDPPGNHHGYPSSFVNPPTSFGPDDGDHRNSNSKIIVFGELSEEDKRRCILALVGRLEPSDANGPLRRFEDEENENDVIDAPTTHDNHFGGVVHSDDTLVSLGYHSNQDRNEKLLSSHQRDDIFQTFRNHLSQDPPINHQHGRNANQYNSNSHRNADVIPHNNPSLEAFSSHDDRGNNLHACFHDDRHNQHYDDHPRMFSYQYPYHQHRQHYPNHHPYHQHQHYYSTNDARHYAYQQHIQHDQYQQHETNVHADNNDIRDHEMNTARNLKSYPSLRWLLRNSLAASSETGNSDKQVDTLRSVLAPTETVNTLHHHVDNMNNHSLLPTHDDTRSIHMNEALEGDITTMDSLELINYNCSNNVIAGTAPASEGDGISVVLYDDDRDAFSEDNDICVAKVDDGMVTLPIINF